jgi:hypothetical protein
LMYLLADAKWVHLTEMFYAHIDITACSPSDNNHYIALNYYPTRPLWQWDALCEPCIARPKAI